MHIDKISAELSILYLNGCQSNCCQNDVFLSLMSVLIEANSADPESSMYSKVSVYQYPE